MLGYCHKLKKEIPESYVRDTCSIEKCWVVYIFQTCQVSRCSWESPGFQKFPQVSRFVKFFSGYCLSSLSKKSLKWKLFHSLIFWSNKLFVLLKLSDKHRRIEQYWKLQNNYGFSISSKSAVFTKGVLLKMHVCGF